MANAVSAHCTYLMITGGYWYKLRGNMICIDVNNMIPLNAIIFYANVLAGNQALYLPFENINFQHVFISWLNLYNL